MVSKNQKSVQILYYSSIKSKKKNYLKKTQHIEKQQQKQSPNTKAVTLKNNLSVLLTLDFSQLVMGGNEMISFSESFRHG